MPILDFRLAIFDFFGTPAQPWAEQFQNHATCYNVAALPLSLATEQSALGTHPQGRMAAKI